MAIRIFSGGGHAGSWADPLNWSGHKVPGIADTALSLTSFSMTVSDAVAVNNIMLLANETITFTGAVSTAGVGTCKGFMVCDDAVVVFAAGSSLNDGGVLQVGIEGTGTLNVVGNNASPTTIRSGQAIIGKTAHGNGTVTIDHAAWITSNALVVGSGGRGTLNVLDSASIVVDGKFAMGSLTGALGQVTLSSAAAITVNGSAYIGGGDTSAAPGTAILTVNAGTKFDAGDRMIVSAGGTVALAGGTVSAGDTNGLLNVKTGGVVVGFGLLKTRANGWITDNGTIEAKGGTLQINANMAGQGSILIDGNSTVAITGQALLMPILSFIGPNATLSLAHGAHISTSIAGFAPGDNIEMAGIDRAVWTSATQTLTLTGNGHMVDTLHLAGDYARDVFSVAQVHGLGVISMHAP